MWSIIGFFVEITSFYSIQKHYNFYENFVDRKLFLEAYNCSDKKENFLSSHRLVIKTHKKEVKTILHTWIDTKTRQNAKFETVFLPPIFLIRK